MGGKMNVLHEKKIDLLHSTNFKFLIQRSENLIHYSDFLKFMTFLGTSIFLIPLGAKKTELCH